MRLLTCLRYVGVAAGLLAALSLTHSAAAQGVRFVKHPLHEDFRTASAVWAADLDGDGDIDVIAAFESQENDIVWWENPGGGSATWNEHSISSDFGGASSICTADIDGDTDFDIVAAAFGRQTVSWWENDGTPADGGWIEHEVDTEFFNSRCARAADIDGDDDIDIVGAAGADDDITWWENTAGNGTTWSEHVVDGDFEYPQGVYPADMDGDNDVDIIGAAATADEIAWWENPGDDSAWTKHTVATSFDEARAVWGVDLDGDSDMDILAAARDGNRVTWWENSAGNGTAWVERDIDTEVDTPTCVVAADIDGDGSTDVVGAAEVDSAVIWWHNSAGDGTLWRRHDVDDLNGGDAVYAADVNGDGRLDIVGGNSVNWFENLAAPALTGCYHLLLDE